MLDYISAQEYGYQWEQHHSRLPSSSYWP